MVDKLTHLKQLEAESIHIIREVAAEFDNPVMLYSIGKDSAVMLHLARKAFFPGKLPFPVMHVDTQWKFQEMYRFREKMVSEYGLELLTHINPDGVAQDMNPFTYGSAKHTDVMKTEGLKQALDKYGFDAAFGGARRDEEKSRAKERVFSVRDSFGGWNPRRQRPELWGLYNGGHQAGENVRVFPISNWTEADVWEYIGARGIALPSIYFAHDREVFNRGGMWLTAGEWGGPRDGEQLETRRVRYRTVGDMSCTGAVDSDASTIDEVLVEIANSTLTERGATRADDRLSESAMEDRKKDGYF